MMAEEETNYEGKFEVAEVIPDISMSDKVYSSAPPVDMVAIDKIISKNWIQQRRQMNTTNFPKNKLLW